MKRLAVFGVALLFVALAAATRVRPHDPVEVAGPDGKPLRVRMVGDEHNHRFETVDGFTVQRNAASGLWQYVAPTDGKTLVDARPSEPHVVLAQFRKNAAKAVESAEASRRALRDVVTGPWTSATHVSGNIPMLIIAVNFTDSQLIFGGRAWVNRLFTDSDSLNAFYELQSYNTTHFTPATESCGVHNDGIAEFSLNMAHPDQDFDLETQAAELAIAQLSTCVDFDVFDKDGDGWIGPMELQAAFIFPGTEGAMGCTSPACPTTWAYQVSSSEGIPVGNKKIGGAIFMSELIDCQCTTLHQIGTLCHEMGHALGLPDLYDVYATQYGGTDTTSYAMWSLMNAGNWCDDLPCNLDPFSRTYLGWANPHYITSEENFTVTVLGTDRNTDVVQMRSIPNGRAWQWRTTVGEGEFFLVENRQNASGLFDEGAPGAGILAWHIRYGIMYSYGNYINSVFGHMIDVVPASNTKTAAGSPIDTWPYGSKTMWSCSTTPNTYLFHGDYTCHNMNVLESSPSPSMLVHFDFADPACEGHCCGNGEIEMGEECDTGNGCSDTCTCTGSFTPYDPVQLICNGSATGNTSTFCGTGGCLTDWLHNGKCDPVCMASADCNYDLDDCPQSRCADCPIEWVGDTMCDDSCFTLGCTWDKYDCFERGSCNSNCTEAMIWNGVCDSECNNKACHYDAGQCLDAGCPAECWFGNLGNGKCTSECDYEACKWDGGDCPSNCPAACTHDLKHNNVCDEVCNNAECAYDLGKCTAPGNSDDSTGAANVLQVASATTVTALLLLCFH